MKGPSFLLTMSSDNFVHSSLVRVFHYGGIVVHWKTATYEYTDKKRDLRQI